MATELFTNEEFQELRRTLHFPDLLGYVEMPIHLGQAMHVNAKKAAEYREAAPTLDEDDDPVWCLDEARRHDEDYQKVADFSARVHKRLRDKRGY